MSRIPTHTVDDAPILARPMLEEIIRASSTGRPLRLHAQMAHAPSVLKGYVSLRGATAELGTFDPKQSAALTLGIAGAIGNAYLLAITSWLARMNGWTDDQIAALRTGATVKDTKVDVLTVLVREATTHAGNVSDGTWQAALRAGWSDSQLADAFAYLALTVVTGYFLNFAQTEPDL